MSFAQTTSNTRATPLLGFSISRWTMSSSPDPVAALGDAWRRAREAFSFSSVRGREATGTHLLRIGNYSTVESVCSRGKCVASEPFRASGQRWKLLYYPNGHKDSTSGRDAVMQLLLDNRFLGRAADATAEYRVAILDGEGSTVYSTSVDPEKYSVNGRSGIWVDVLEGKAEERKQALRRLKDDSLCVRCDVTVQSLEKEARCNT